MSTLNLIAIDVGHTRTTVAPVCAGTLGDTVAAADQSLSAMVQAVQAALTHLPDNEPHPLVIASVNEPVAANLRSALIDQLGHDVYTVGEDLPVGITTKLDPEAVPGVDRLLGALAAWDTMQQACIVVDAGTCVTVDFIDGEGVYHGGAIAPGLAMQLQAMHDGTTTLPEMEPDTPNDNDAFARSTATGMQLGAFAGIRGLVRVVAERYALAYEAFPPIIVTGGDAERLFRNDELIDRIVPDLVLRGIAAAADRVITAS